MGYTSLHIFYVHAHELTMRACITPRLDYELVHVHAAGNQWKERVLIVAWCNVHTKHTGEAKMELPTMLSRVELRSSLQVMGMHANCGLGQACGLERAGGMRGDHGYLD